MQTAEIRGCQPGEAVREGVVRPGAAAALQALGRPGLVQTGGQEFGHWVRSAMALTSLHFSTGHSL